MSEAEMRKVDLEKLYTVIYMMERDGGKGPALAELEEADRALSGACQIVRYLVWKARGWIREG